MRNSLLRKVNSSVVAVPVLPPVAPTSIAVAVADSFHGPTPDTLGPACMPSPDEEFAQSPISLITSAMKRGRREGGSFSICF